MQRNKHFDTLKNKLPENWTNENATRYYNRAFWERAKCEYGTDNSSKRTADKWYPTATESSKWTRGCDKSSDYYKKSRNYYYTYNNECTTADCQDECCNPQTCADKCGACFGGCDKKPDKCDKKFKVYNSKNCNGCDCNDVAIIYRFVNEGTDCDNLVELRVPVGGSKEQYLAKYFSSEFIDKHRFLCAEAPVYNTMPNNVIDNQRQYEFTESDQAALTKRGIKNALYAKQLIDEGKLINNTATEQINQNAKSYYFSNKQYKTGLSTNTLNAYFY